MGKLEQRNKKRSKRKNLQQIILGTVATAGVLAVALVVPGVFVAMKRLGFIPNKRQKEYISSSASKMVRGGLLRYNGKFYELTQLGKERLHVWKFNNFKFDRPKRWDKKWRVIIFDIPEKKRKMRDKIRHLFNQAGLYRLQDSVWVYPYDCEDILTLLKSDLGIGKNVLYLIVDELENDKYLREFFLLG